MNQINNVNARTSVHRIVLLFWELKIKISKYVKGFFKKSYKEVTVYVPNNFNGQVAFQTGEDTTTTVMVYRNGIRIRDHIIPGEYCRRLANLGAAGIHPCFDESKLS